MRTEGDILRSEDIKGVHLRSYKDRYILFDNLEVREKHFIYTYSELNNQDFTYLIVVLHDTLNMVVNNKLVEVNANEVFIITPFVHFELLESNCVFMCIAVRDEIIEDIYEHCGFGGSVSIRYYNTHHYRLESQDVEILQNDYSLLRFENERSNYSMKEMTLRAFVVSFLGHFFSFLPEEGEIMHGDCAKGWDFYCKFMGYLDIFYRKEREVQFYANKIGITPKYLSVITVYYTGHTASVVIDNYVACRIKQMLYSNNVNIKKIGEMYNFPNQSFFGRFFKRIVGESPYEYQKSHNRKLID